MGNGRTLAQRAMQSAAIVRIYESRLWRRSLVATLALGISFEREQELIGRAARLSPGDTLLDLACGPGIWQIIAGLLRFDAARRRALDDMASRCRFRASWSAARRSVADAGAAETDAGVGFWAACVEHGLHRHRLPAGSTWQA